MDNIKVAFDKFANELIEDIDSVTGDTDILSLIPDDFMKKYTRYDNLIDFIQASGQAFISQESWNLIQDGSIDDFIRKNSEFDSWEDMITIAGNEYLLRNLT